MARPPESLTEAKQTYEANGVPLSCYERMSGTFAHSFVKVAYEDSPDFAPFQSFNPFKQELCKFVQKHGTETPHKRDLLESGFAKRFIVGFKQGQGHHSSNTVWVQPGNDSDSRVGLAFFNPEEDKISQMSPGLKAAIGDVASKLKQFMEKSHPGRVSDQLRERLFGSRFAAIWGDECTCDYEFVDFFCESGSMLGRHMDYLNGKNSGYDFVSSYSYCVSLEDGKEYRQNIIMTHRSWCDANMANLEKKGIDNANCQEAVV